MTEDGLRDQLRVLDQLRGQVIQQLREAGEPVHQQRTRIRLDNPKLVMTWEALQEAGAMGLTKHQVAKLIGRGHHYAFDILEALRAAGKAEKLRPGHYRAKEYDTRSN